MKKRALAICAVAAIFAFAAAFAEENAKIASTLWQLEENLSYYVGHSSEACELVLEGDFLPQDVQPQHIELLHEFMGRNHRNKIEGAIEYIYFDGMHSPDAFSKIRERIDGAKDKFVCVDIGHSNYMRLDGERYPLPDNCFAGHENLYWVYAGSFLREKVPHNFCADCPNLQFVFLWEYGKAARTAFSGSNKSLLILDSHGLSAQKTLEEFFEEAQVFDPWDYRSLDSEHFVPENQREQEKGWRDDDSNFDDDEAEGDDGDFNDYSYDDEEDERIPPVTQERLEEILSEIVERESKIIAKEESDGAVDEDGFCYIHKNSNTILVDSDGKSPYLYMHVQNPNPNDKRNDLIIVLYARPSAEYVFFFEFCKAGLSDSINLDLDSDFDDLYGELESAYLAGADKSERLQWQTNARILGRQNDVYFLRLEEDDDGDKENAR